MYYHIHSQDLKKLFKTETKPEHPQTSKMKSYVKMVNSF